MAVSVKDFLDAIRGRFNDEPNKVEVTGSNVEVVDDWEVAITDTGTQTRSDIDISKYTNLQFHILNSLENDNGDRVKLDRFIIRLGQSQTQTRVWDESESAWRLHNDFLTLETDTAAGTIAHHLNTKYSFLNDLVADKLRIELRAEESPVSGTFTVRIYGRVI